jgi:protein-tyrosine phosphatase
MGEKRVRVLFVCLGNICRSPLGEGVMAHLVNERGLSTHIKVDSCGTIGHHAGEPPDGRSIAVAKKHQIDLTGQRSRQLRPEDLEIFDYILAMDRSNLAGIKQLATDHSRASVSLMLEHGSGRSGKDVPDPYYGGPQGFDLVYDMILEACEGLLDSIVQEHSL